MIAFEQVVTSFVVVVVEIRASSSSLLMDYIQNLDYYYEIQLVVQQSQQLMVHDMMVIHDMVNLGD
jgi:hypothetical protein